jgi:hypothetical protein
VSGHMPASGQSVSLRIVVAGHQRVDVEGQDTVIPTWADCNTSSRPRAIAVGPPTKFLRRSRAAISRRNLLDLATQLEADAKAIADGLPLRHPPRAP